jgi:uncharacterized protein (DUF58 family)
MLFWDWWLILIVVIALFGLTFVYMMIADKLHDWSVERYDRNERTRINKTGIVYRYYGKK